MKKVICNLLVVLILGPIVYNFAHATIYLTPDTKPINVVKYIRNGGKDIIKTDLDEVDSLGNYEASFKISNTLDYVREHMAAYLQWMAGIGLIASVILLIYNGIVLMTSPLSSDQTATVKKRIKYILIGALAITWFYFVLRVLLSIILQLLNN